jgi:hypothetical protein
MANRIRPLQQIKRTAPPDVYYVVESSGKVGKRDHHVISPLYETRSQADEELGRLRAERKKGVLSVWMRTTYCEPPQWLSDVLMADGTVIRAPK